MTHYPAPAGVCGSDWGSGVKSQQCVRYAGHDTPHRDQDGHEWENRKTARPDGIGAVRELIEATGLGTPGAKALRDRADPAVAAQIIERADRYDSPHGFACPSCDAAGQVPTHDKACWRYELGKLWSHHVTVQARADVAAYKEHMAAPAPLDDAGQREHKLRDAELAGCMAGSLAALLTVIDAQAGAL